MFAADKLQLLACGFSCTSLFRVWLDRDHETNIFLERWLKTQMNIIRVEVTYYIKGTIVKERQGKRSAGRQTTKDQTRLLQMPCKTRSACTFQAIAVRLVQIIHLR
jgi:hypothetical protein